MIADDDCGATGGMRIRKGNRSTRRKPQLALNLGCCGEKPATNRLSYGTDLIRRQL
jgi:hypothetical protein